MTFIFTSRGQSYLVHTEVGGANTTKVVVEPVETPAPLPAPVPA